MRAYNRQTAPVLAHYRALGRYAEVAGDQPVEQVTESILAAVALLRS
jgi:adenylate kinase